MRDFLYSRIAALLWSVLFTFVLLADVQLTWQEIGARFPAWRWLVAGYLFILLHCYLLHREARIQEDLRRAIYRQPISTRIMRVVVGGWIGVISWTFSFAALGVGWIFGGVGGLAIGAVIAKISYLPWIVGVVREARRKPVLV
jgi:hypothetical protein